MERNGIRDNNEMKKIHDIQICFLEARPCCLLLYTQKRNEKEFHAVADPLRLHNLFKMIHNF